MVYSVYNEMHLIIKMYVNRIVKRNICSPHNQGYYMCCKMYCCDYSVWIIMLTYYVL